MENKGNKKIKDVGVKEQTEMDKQKESMTNDIKLHSTI